MPDQDVLGPGAAGAPRSIPSSDPSITATINFPDASDTWFQDCVNNTAGTGTPYVAEWANRQLQMIRRVIRNSGIPLTYADDQLAYGIQQGLQWVGTFGGTANALTATMVPAPMLLLPGTEIKGFVGASNTGNVTLNVNGLGTLPVSKSDATPLNGGEMMIGGVASFIYTGSGFVLLDPAPSIFLRVAPQNLFYIRTGGSDTLYDGTTPTISGTHGPFATIPGAVSKIQAEFASPGLITLDIGAGSFDGESFTSAFVNTWALSGAGSGVTFVNGVAGSGGVGVNVGTGCSVSVDKMSMTSTGGLPNIAVQPGGSVAIGTVHFSVPPSGGSPISSFGGRVGGANPTNVWTFASATYSTFLFVELGGQAILGANNGITTNSVTLAYGTSAVSIATMETASGGTIQILPAQFSQTGTVTGSRFNCTTGGGINSQGGGAGLITGSSGGSTGTAPNNGWYQ